MSGVSAIGSQPLFIGRSLRSWLRMYVADPTNLLVIRRLAVQPFEDAHVGVGQLVSVDPRVGRAGQ